MEERGKARGLTEGGLGVDVVGALLLACRDIALVDGRGARVAQGGEFGRAGVRGRVARRVVQQDLGDVVVAHEREDEMQPVDQVRLGGNVWRREERALVGVVLKVLRPGQWRVCSWGVASSAQVGERGSPAAE